MEYGINITYIQCYRRLAEGCNAVLSTVPSGFTDSTALDRPLPTDATIRALFEEFDSGHNGTLTYAELVNANRVQGYRGSGVYSTY